MPWLTVCDGDGPGHGQDAAFRGTVHGKLGIGHQAHYGTHVDNRATPRLCHNLDRVFAGEEVAAEVDVDHRPPLLVRRFVQRDLILHGGVVDKYVDLAKAGKTGINGAADVVLAAHIGPVKGDLAATRCQRRRYALSRLGGPGDAEDRGTLEDESLGNGRADALADSRHDRDLPLQSHRLACPSALTPRLRARTTLSTGQPSDPPSLPGTAMERHTFIGSFYNFPMPGNTSVQSQRCQATGALYHGGEQLRLLRRRGTETNPAKTVPCHCPARCGTCKPFAWR